MVEYALFVKTATMFHVKQWKTRADRVEIVRLAPVWNKDWVGSAFFGFDVRLFRCYWFSRRSSAKIRLRGLIELSSKNGGELKWPISPDVSHKFPLIW